MRCHLSRYYQERLQQYRRVRTPVLCRFLSGPQGGDQQIGARIAYNEIDLVLFFRDPLTTQTHEPDVAPIIKLCDIHNVPIATNIATAEVLVHGLDRGDMDWRDIVNPKNKK